METTLYLIMSFFGGAVTGAALNHWLTKDRDRKNRRLDFLDFLGRWLSEIRRITGQDISGTHAAYMTRVHEFHGYVARVRSDFWQRSRFTKLTSSVGDIRGAQINNDADDCRNIIAHPIERLIAWL